MPTIQLGNNIGVAARAADNQHIGVVAANGGANAISILTAAAEPILNWSKMKQNMLIDCASPAGVVRFTNRLVVYIINNGSMSYSGADAPTVAAGDLIYVAGAITKNQPSNTNGGVSAMRGFRLEGAFTLGDIRDRLNEINPTYYTSTRMDQLTYNDLIYALRLAEAPGSI